MPKDAEGDLPKSKTHAGDSVEDSGNQGDADSRGGAQASNGESPRDINGEPIWVLIVEFFTHLGQILC